MRRKGRKAPLNPRQPSLFGNTVCLPKGSKIEVRPSEPLATRESCKKEVVDYKSAAAGDK